MARHGRAVSVEVSDRFSIEVATGYGGRGVFLTPVSARGSRVVTVGLGWVGAQRLADVLAIVAEAAKTAERERPEPR